MNLPTDIYTLVFGYVNRLEIRPLSKILNEAFLEKFCFHPQPHGIVEEFHQAGKIISISYKNGKLDGPYKTWFNNGKLRVDSYYKDDLKNGPYKHWYDSGHLFIDSTYIDGKRNGPYKYWYYNGQLQNASTYKNGVLDGPHKEWYPSGQLEIDSIYKNGIKKS